MLVEAERLEEVEREAGGGRPPARLRKVGWEGWFLRPRMAEEEEGDLEGEVGGGRLREGAAAGERLDVVRVRGRSPRGLSSSSSVSSSAGVGFDASDSTGGCEEYEVDLGRGFGSSCP